jgi:hypothetical protein
MSHAIAHIPNNNDCPMPKVKLLMKKSIFFTFWFQNERVLPALSL